MVHLQQFSSLHDVMKLALKVERQIKAKSTIINRSGARDGFAKAPSSKTSVTPKTTPKVQSKSEGKQPQPVTTSTHQKRCFKCVKVWDKLNLNVLIGE